MSGDASPAVISTLAELVSINSVNPNYQGGVNEASIAQYVEQFFQKRGIATQRQYVFKDRPNVIARLPGRESKRRIILEAHLDTVSAVGMTIEPWTATIRDGKLFGRGACDTKAGLAAMMHAVAAVHDRQHVPACEVLFAATIDEEFSYRGVARLCQGLPTGGDQQNELVEPLWADAAIVAEPTSLRVVTASKGLVRWSIETRGLAAHSSKPQLGNNAIEQMAIVIAALGEHSSRLSRITHPLLGSPTCNVGVIGGGSQVNLVPDRCEIEIDRRMLPGETVAGVLAEYQGLLDELAEVHPQLDAVMHTPQLTDFPLETDRNEPPVISMLEILRERGLDDVPLGVPFGSDASKFGAIGIPSIIFGPGSIDQAHGPNEYVPCDQVIEACEIYRQFLLQFGERR